MYVCWDVHQDTYLDIWVGRVIIIRCQDNNLLCYSTNLVIPLISLQLLSSDFTSDFWFMSITMLYLLTSYFTTCVLFLQSPALIILYHTCSQLDIELLSLLGPACWYSRHGFNAYLWLGFIDTHVLISTRHLAFASPLAGEFWLLWILMPRFWSLKRVDSPSYWSEWRSGSVDLQQTVRSPILPGPLVQL